MFEYRFRSVSGEYKEVFISAWEMAFSRKLNRKTYEWIFNEKNIIYAIEISGEIAGGYCLYPLNSMVNGKFKKALLCNNVFVSPEHQGKQLFVKIGKMALVDAGQRGACVLAYGIPNALALPGHKRVGWEVRESIKFLENSKQSAIKVAGTNWIRYALSDKIRSDIQSCSLRASAGRGFSIIKTAEFVYWRYECKPNSKYWFGLKYEKEMLVAYCVCKYFEEDEVLHFIDIDGTDNFAIERLIEEAQGIPGNFNKLNIWGSSIHRGLFEGAGYQVSDQANNLIFINPSKLRPFNFEGEINIVLGDNDVF